MSGFENHNKIKRYSTVHNVQKLKDSVEGARRAKCIYLMEGRVLSCMGFQAHYVCLVVVTLRRHRLVILVTSQIIGNNREVEDEPCKQGRCSETLRCWAVWEGWRVYVAFRFDLEEGHHYHVCSRNAALESLQASLHSRRRRVAMAS